MKYKLVVCGGTFDHFHQGHAAFLQSALAISEHVLIGVTTDAYIQRIKRGNTAMQSFIERKQGVETFLAGINAVARTIVAPIDSVFYPHEWESLPIEAIISTEETKKGADTINEDRKQKGLPLLDVVITPYVADDTGKKIASTNIRQGKINNEGISYVQPSWFHNDLFLPAVEKQWFKHPFGELHRDNAFLSGENPQKVVTVGDVVTTDCNAISFKQKLSVIDFTIQRQDTFHNIEELGFSGKEKIFTVTNPASHLTKDLMRAIMQSIELFQDEDQIVIVVRGEEDLSVIPLVLALPLGYIVVYGQPHEGVVRLEITEEVKKKAHSLLGRFIVSP